MEIKYTGDLTQAHEGDAGYDLRAKGIVALQEYYKGSLVTAKDMETSPFGAYYKFELPLVIKPGFRACVDTGVIVDFPEGVYGEIWPRSGLAFKHGIDVLAGLIDPGYRDVIKVILINFGTQDFTINENDRIAQLVIGQLAKGIKLVNGETNLETNRGTGGFGSSGIK